MSIDQSLLRMLVRQVRTYDLKGRVLLLGVQDVLGSYEDMEAVLLEEGYPLTRIPMGERRYSLSRRQREFSLLFNRNFMHVKDLFKMMNFTEVDTLDAFDNEGPDIQHDLNSPIPEDLHDRYDVIIDIGVSEHVFNVHQAMKNVTQMLKLNGVVIYVIPLMGWHNQCFYNMQPPLFFDIFGANGFGEMYAYLNYIPKYGQGRGSKTQWREIRYNDEVNFSKPFHYTLIFFAARKLEALPEFVTPLQGFYVEHHRKDGDDGRTAESQSISFLEQVPGPVRRLYPLLVPVFRAMPNWARVIALDGVLMRVKRQRALRGRKVFHC